MDAGEEHRSQHRIRYVCFCSLQFDASAWCNCKQPLSRPLSSTDRLACFCPDCKWRMTGKKAWTLSLVLDYSEMVSILYVPKSAFLIQNLLTRILLYRSLSSRFLLILIQLFSLFQSRCLYTGSRDRTVHSFDLRRPKYIAAARAKQSVDYMKHLDNEFHLIISTLAGHVSSDSLDLLPESRFSLMKPKLTLK